MTIRHEPSHGYREWISLYCDHCGKIVSDGNGYENAIERSPEEAVIIEEFSHDSRPRRILQFCDADCQKAYEES